MDEPYRIRSGRATDLAAVADLERLLFADAWSDPTLARHLGRDSLVAEWEGRVVGFVFFRHAADEGEILDVAVAPGHRRRGVAGQLVAGAFERMRRCGVGRVFLEVRESNADARAFYRALGFAEVGRRAGYYRNPPEAALVLAVDLEPAAGTA